MLESLFEVLIYIFSVTLVLFLLFLGFLIYITKPYPEINRQKEETTYLDPESVQSHAFPSIANPPTLTLSVIIPAYNEEKRLPIMLDESMAFLESKVLKDPNFVYEVIVVSDGSNDNTVAVALKYARKYTAERLRVMELVQNRGKGGAVRLGILSARGRSILFADADGATKFEDYEKLAVSLSSLTKDWQEEAVVVGSRAHLEQNAIANRSFFRTILMHGFHFLVWLFAVRSIRDTQCGFKLLTRSAAQKLFYSLHVERWAFDVELLYLAERLKMPIIEVAVRWTEIEGSKLTPFWSWVQMGTDLILIWLRYAIGAWKIASLQKKEA